MPELDADFIISNNNQLEAEYELGEGQHFDCSFEIFASGTTWRSIAGDPYDNEALSDILNQKADTSTVETLSETVTNNYNTLDNKIDTHIANTTNPHEVTKTQVGLGNVDNTSDLNKPISTATQTALNGKQNTISDLSTIRTNASNGQSAYNTIQTYGDIVTYDASSFATNLQGQKADTALQPNDDITKLNNNAGYITSADVPIVNNSTITFQKNNVTVGDINLNQSNNETINFNIPTTASDVNALPDTTTIEDLTTTAQQNAINSGATISNIGQIATNTSNINSLSNTVTSNYNTLDGRITSEVSTLNTSIGTETTNRQNADNNLQSQIDAIVSSSDVFDIVGTYAELQAYDISTVPVNDIIKVLVDSTHSNAATYYRCVETGGVKSWLYIGSEGAYYTKSEADNLFVEQTTTVNNKPLSNNITLTASDVGALPSTTTIGNGILTIQNNSVDVDTFSANATGNKTINLVTPTKTSDLTNDSGFIDSSALAGLATQTDLTNGLATKQDTISDLSTIRSNATNGQSAYTTIQGYGDIVTYNASNFATSTQGSLADTALQQGDNISLLNNDAGFITGIGSSDVITALGYTPYNSTNPNGYTSNIGTVTSVNNTQPDANGNVTIPTGGTVDQTYDPTSENAQSGVAINGAGFLQNTATGTGSLTIDGDPTSVDGAINIGHNSSVVLSAGGQAARGTAIGVGAKVTGTDSIQLGIGAASLNSSLYAGFYLYGNYQLLDGTTGLIPDARISSNIQRTSTAVTHTANTSVGSSTTPVYVNSSGVVTSTGLSIASSRFDGQWISKFSTLRASSAASVGTTTINLSTYLGNPSSSSQYEVFVAAGGNDQNGGYFYLSSGCISGSMSDSFAAFGLGSTNGTRFQNWTVFPVSANYTITLTVGSAIDRLGIYALGYRRLGTNS